MPALIYYPNNWLVTVKESHMLTLTWLQFFIWLPRFWLFVIHNCSSVDVFDVKGSVDSSASLICSLLSLALATFQPFIHAIADFFIIWTILLIFLGTSTLPLDSGGNPSGSVGTQA